MRRTPPPPPRSLRLPPPWGGGGEGKGAGPKTKKTKKRSSDAPNSISASMDTWRRRGAPPQPGALVLEAAA